MLKNSPQKPCLLLVNKGSAESVSTAIKQSQHLVDSYVVIDLAANLDAQTLSESNLHLKGTVISDHCWLGIGHAITVAKEAAKQWSDTLLWLEPDEEILVLSDNVSTQLPLISGEYQAHILVTNGKFSLAEPRLFSTRLDYSVGGELLPLIDPSQIKGKRAVRTLPHHVQIAKKADVQTSSTDREPLLDAELQIASSHNATLGLSSVLEKLKRGDAHSAYSLLNNLNMSNDNASQQARWTQQYLMGVASQARNDFDSAVQHYQTAIDISSDNLEAYARLIEISLLGNHNEAAGQLAEVANGLSWVNGAIYTEPGLYGRDFLALQLRAFVADNRYAEAVKLKHVLLPQLAKTDLMQLALSECDEMQRLKQPPAAPHTPANKTSATTPKRPKLTIGMATYDDFDGVYFTIMSILLFHQDCLDEIELLIIDNNPASAHGEAVSNLAKRVKARYIAAAEFKGTTVRERVFLEAQGDFVMCVDCHVFLHQGVVRKLLDYIDLNPNSKDIWHGPLVAEDMGSFSTHMEERWQQGFYGVFQQDDRAKDPNSEPFEIPMQGLALFVCKRSNWAGFNRKFRGFGGEEGYIHYKFKLAGGKTWCLPFLRWTHRFPRPNGVKYENRFDHRVRNYILGWSEIGRDTQTIYDHFSEQLGSRQVAQVHRALQDEMASPFWHYDAVYCLSPNETAWSSVQPFMQNWGLSMSIQRIDCTESLDGYRSALLSVLNIAQSQNLPNVVVLLGLLPDERASKGGLSTWLNDCRQRTEASFYPAATTNLARAIYIPANRYSQYREAWRELSPKPTSKPNEPAPLTTEAPLSSNQIDALLSLHIN